MLNSYLKKYFINLLTRLWLAFSPIEIKLFVLKLLFLFYVEFDEDSFVKVLQLLKIKNKHNLSNAAFINIYDVTEKLIYQKSFVQTSTQ